MANRDGKLIRQYETHCRDCESPALGLGETVADATRDLGLIGWKKIGGLWFCKSCARERNKLSPTC